MIVKVMKEEGYEEAMIGLSLAFNQPVEKMPMVANKLNDKGGSHVKFLESMVVWLDITAPRYWWQQFDTYRVGITKQSQSTMHTIMRRKLTQKDFQLPISDATLKRLNELIESGMFVQVKTELPEGFLQRRIVCTNYKALRHMFSQRNKHRLHEWIFFLGEVISQVKYPYFIIGDVVT